MLKLLPLKPPANMNFWVISINQHSNIVGVSEKKRLLTPLASLPGNGYIKLPSGKAFHHNMEEAFHHLIYFPAPSGPPPW